MKRKCILPLSALIASTLCCCEPSVKQKEMGISLGCDSNLVVRNRYYDIGKIKVSQTDSIDFSFGLENRGKENIEVHNVDVSCNCITVHDIPHNIPSNTTAYIKGKMGVSQNIGTFNKTLFVNYNNDEVLLLRIKGEFTK